MQIPKHKPPSRVRYEKTHPTISFRLDDDLKTRLKKVLEGQSFASFIKEALGVREREERSIEDAHDEGYNKGFAEGYNNAKNEFVVDGPCAICGKPIIVRKYKDKVELARFIKSQGWCHLRCKEAVERY